MLLLLSNSAEEHGLEDEVKITHASKRGVHKGTQTAQNPTQTSLVNMDETPDRRSYSRSRLVQLTTDSKLRGPVPYVEDVARAEGRSASLIPGESLL